MGGITMKSYTLNLNYQEKKQSPIPYKNINL